MKSTSSFQNRRVARIMNVKLTKHFLHQQHNTITANLLHYIEILELLKLREILSLSCNSVTYNDKLDWKEMH